MGSDPRAPGSGVRYCAFLCLADEMWFWCGCDSLGSITFLCESRFSLGAIYEFPYGVLGCCQ